MKYCLLILSIFFACLNSHAQEKYFSYRYEHCNTTVFLHSEIDGDPYFKDKDSVRNKLQSLVGTWECETEGVFDLNIEYNQCVKLASIVYDSTYTYLDQCWAKNVQHTDFNTSYDIQIEYLTISDLNEKVYFRTTYNLSKNSKVQEMVAGCIYFMGDNKFRMEILGVDMEGIGVGLYYNIDTAKEEIRENTPDVFKNGPYIFNRKE